MRWKKDLSKRSPCPFSDYGLTTDLRIDSEPILVLVGASKYKFYIHEKLIRSNSGFFDTALKKEWAEGQDRRVELPSFEVDIFKVWIKWLYTGRIFLTTEGDLQKDHTGVYKSCHNTRWASCYALADYIHDSDFKDAAIDAMIEVICQTNLYPFSLAGYIYPHSVKGSAHRMLAVDLFTKYWRRDDYIRSIDQPKEFLHDVLVSIGPDLAEGVKRHYASRLPIDKDTCKYHDHGPDKPCYKTKPAFRF